MALQILSGRQPVEKVQLYSMPYIWRPMQYMAHILK